MSRIHVCGLSEGRVLKAAVHEDKVVQRHVFCQHKFTGVLHMSRQSDILVRARHAECGLHKDLIHFAQGEIFVGVACELEGSSGIFFIQIAQRENSERLGKIVGGAD